MITKLELLDKTATLITTNQPKALYKFLSKIYDEMEMEKGLAYRDGGYAVQDEIKKTLGIRDE